MFLTFYNVKGTLPECLGFLDVEENQNKILFYVNEDRNSCVPMVKIFISSLGVIEKIKLDRYVVEWNAWIKNTTVSINKTMGL